LASAKQSLAEATEQAKRHFDQRRTVKEFLPGERVMLKTKNLRFKQTVPNKLRPRYIGPYAIAERVGSVTYRLALPDTMRVHPVFHVEMLRGFKGTAATPPPAVECDDGSQRYEVESIIGLRNNGQQLLVRWKGYDASYDTYEPSDALNEDCPELIAEFYARQPELLPQARRSRRSKSSRAKA
jgi:hypothetical protein